MKKNKKTSPPSQKGVPSNAGKSALESAWKGAREEWKTCALLCEHRRWFHAKPFLQTTLQMYLGVWLMMHGREQTSLSLKEAAQKLHHEVSVWEEFPMTLWQGLEHLDILSPQSLLSEAQQAEYQRLFEELTNVITPLEVHLIQEFGRRFTEPWLQVSRRWGLKLAQGCVLGFLGLACTYGAYWWINPQASMRDQGQVFWNSHAEPTFVEAQSQLFPVVISGQFLLYRVELDFPQILRQVRLDAASLPIDRATLDTLELFDANGQLVQRFDFQAKEVGGWSGTMQAEMVWGLTATQRERLAVNLTLEEQEALQTLQDRLYFTEAEFRQALQQQLPRLEAPQLETLVRLAKRPSYLPKRPDYFLESPVFAEREIKTLGLRMRLDMRQPFWRWVMGY